MLTIDFMMAMSSMALWVEPPPEVRPPPVPIGERGGPGMRYRCVLFAGTHGHERNHAGDKGIFSLPGQYRGNAGAALFGNSDIDNPVREILLEL
jgi:hypothetical protein